MNMKERIEEFLRRENKTYIQFAQEIGVQPSSISHILSGRNKPSLDFVLKMLSRYKNISPSWLLFGKGEMYTDYVSSLFDNRIMKDDDKESLIEIQPSESSVQNKISFDEKDKKEIKTESKVPKKPARRIIIFYDDNTFDEYFPD